ncbi:unnamed protein product [Paramecium primaurelia]|uniref:Transmembrane protein n=1 Tax=Paramecium primaurelia TaxID=5886 RepID=A0A8S1PMX7_PARPR|nr:unnamed protein product [Paramecium primaurelia]
MKLSIETENCRRTKTNPDQNSIISYSTNKSCNSSERKTQVKVACKVLCEMREDESSKLAMKFTQLRIVLATQSLLHLLQKYKSAKLQSYFWIIQQERKTTKHNGFIVPNQTISLQPVIKDLSNHQIRVQIYLMQYQQIPTVTAIVLNHVLNKIIIQQQKSIFKRIKAQSNIYKAITQIKNFIQQCQKRSQYIGLINIMKCNQNRKIQKTSVLDQNHEIQSEDELSEQIIDHPEEMTIKEQLAIKFASTTIISSILNEKIKKQQFALFFNILRGQFQNKQLNLSQTNEITQIYEQSYLDQDPILIGTSHLCSVVYARLKDYQQEIKKVNQNKELLIEDSLHTLILCKHSEQSNNNSYEDLYTQRILPSQFKHEEEENDNEIQILENNNYFKMPCSLQHITDIDILDSTKEIEQKIQDTQQIQSKIKNKHQDLIKNAVKSYCNQQQRKNSLQGTPRTQQREENRENVIKKSKKQDKQLYIIPIIGICMIALIFLILQ